MQAVYLSLPIPVGAAAGCELHYISSPLKAQKYLPDITTGEDVKLPTTFRQFVMKQLKAFLFREDILSL